MNTAAAVVLTQNDIRNIRHYVHHKYAALPNERKAEIVADAMQRIVLRQLPEFPEKIRRELMSRLIKDVIALQRPVSTDDIFNACLHLGLDMDKLELFQPLHVWMEQRLQVIVEPDTFRNMLQQSALEAHELTNEGLTPWRIIAMKAAALQIVPSGDSVGLEPRGQLIRLPFLRKRSLRSLMYGLSCFMIIVLTLGYGLLYLIPAPSSTVNTKPTVPAEVNLAPTRNSLPAELQFSEFDRSRLLDYLNKKSSLLAESPYFEAIINAAKKFNVDPLLLFAITGQEQAFVPREHKLAKKIANNPFNVYHSYLEYNTNIADASKIAARTIVNLSKGRPHNVDAVTWINRKYAEDPNWSEGVRKIWTDMKHYVKTGTKQ